MSEQDQELHKYKNRILTEIYNTGILQQKIQGMAFRNRINKDSYIYQDAIQETFMWLCRKQPQEIIEMYEDDPKRIIGLGVKIAVLKCFSANKNDPDYPKHSLCRYILFASTFNTMQHISSTECSGEDDPNDYNKVLVDRGTEEDPDKELWALIRSELTAEQNEWLTYFINLKKTQGRYLKHVKEAYTDLLNAIEAIIITKKINI